MPSDQPLAYLILGTPHSGRRDVLADLIDGTQAQDGTTAVFLPDTEPPAEADQKLGSITRWIWTEAPSIDARLPEGCARVFLVTDGRRNPIDQIEAFKAWLSTEGAELARIICVVNCHLAEQHPQMLAWYDACIHFADVVLLSRREGVANKWISDFQARYKDQYFPCHMEMVKAGRVHNPALVLEPLPLRISHAFDPDLQWVVKGPDGEDIDEDEEPDEDEEVELVPAEDPYFIRRNGGRREKQIPEIEKFLVERVVPNALSDAAGQTSALETTRSTPPTSPPPPPRQTPSPSP